MTDRQPHETVRLTLEIDRRLYDDIRETAKRMGFEVEAWCIAALEVGVEANLPEEAP